VRRRAMGREHWNSSVRVGAPHLERVGAYEAEHDSVLIVHPHPVQVSSERAHSCLR
jgi:hypothetical protein